MSLSLLLRDELNGFYRSRVMMALWIGLPVLSVFLYLVAGNVGQIPLAAFTSLLVGSIGGVISAAMLAISIINERERHVYDLFVIRPVKRWSILMSKFLAVYACVAIAGLIAMLFGLAVDTLVTRKSAGIDLDGLADSLIILLSMMAISCSAGILIGVLSPSVLVGVILVLYGGNQLSALVILPVLLLSTERWFPLIPGAAISALLLVVSIILFNRKQL